MHIAKQISDFLSPLNSNPLVYKSISELIATKIKNPSFSIRTAKKRGILNLSGSDHYDAINEPGKLFIEGKISLQDFLFGVKTYTKISDATLLKRAGKKVYGAKKIKNYVNGAYELLQDVLFTTERYKGLNFITEFRIINHNKRHLSKPKEIVKAIKSGNIKKEIGLSLMVV
jgi:hypothetical protein